MGNRVLKVLAWLAGIIVVLFICVSTVLWAPFFSDMRRSFLQDVLTGQIGQPLLIDGDVAVDLGPTTHLKVLGARIPSENIDQLDLAKLGAMELDANLASLLRGEFGVDNLRISELQINLVTQEDGVTSWTVADGSMSSKSDLPDAPDDTGQNSQFGIIDFLQDKTVAFANIGLDITNKNSGFEFEFELEDLSIDQLEEGQLVSLESSGSVNGEPFSIKSRYPRGGSLTTKATFGQLELDLDGTPTPDEQGGFSADLALNTGEIGELLDILKLARVLEGRGTLSAGITSTSAGLQVADVRAEVDFDEGQRVEFSGSVENLIAPSGVDLNVDVRLHPENQPPPPARQLKDLKLSGMTAQIVSDGEDLKFNQLEFQTNAFDQNFSELGPISIESIRRSETGQLSLLGIEVQIGPEEAPYVQANGQLLDLLQLKDLEFEGTLGAPATLILPADKYENAEAFGRVQADFSVSDTAGHLTLSNLNAYTADTDLWSLSAKMRLADVTRLDGAEADLSIDAPSGKSLLEALNLEPIDTGPFGFSVSTKGEGKDLKLAASLKSGQSEINASIESSVGDGSPIVRGAISSERIWIDDILNGISGATQLASLGNKNGNAGKEDQVSGESSPSSTKPTEPLVLKKPEEPLVIKDPDQMDDGPGDPSDFLDLENVAAKTDLAIEIDIKKIEGQQGISSVKTDLAISDGKLKFGPLDFSYGGGSFNVSAGMDIIETPDLLNISGSTRGWSIGEILKTAGVNLDARGELRAEFNLTGNRSSPKSFLRSMYGTAFASINNGAIASSLIELAGLGVLPWLFSEELNKGYSTIVCAVAPLKIQSGKISTGSTVIETKRVQMVIGGSLDWRNETIAMRAEPRPVGKPLARSAVPIEITGSLRKPNINLQLLGSGPDRENQGKKAVGERTPCKPDIKQVQ